MDSLHTNFGGRYMQPTKDVLANVVFIGLPRCASDDLAESQLSQTPRPR
jgi:hypothetical protein